MVIPVPPLAFLDANIFFSRTLRDWICLSSIHSDKTAYDLRWSEDVLAEYVYNWRRKNPDASDAALGGVRRNLQKAFPHAMITGYSPTSVAELSDPHDRHVLAAALHGQVDILVTDNKKHFPDSVVTGRLEVYTADEFLCWVIERHPELIMHKVLSAQILHFTKNAIISGERSQHELIEALRRAKAGSFAAKLEALCDDTQHDGMVTSPVPKVPTE